ncbi:MAG: hypothetical protein CM1200mP33_7610 [Chloroflexota bacterium]|nr:MAG: hypothetical protein CM1200mP33_7610 [Chloroflexota bacterium]
MNKILLEIEKLLPEELKNKSKKYKHKISDLLDDNSIDESRIAMEVSIIAEKSDVTEEIVRLKNHFDQFNVINF